MRIFHINIKQYYKPDFVVENNTFYNKEVYNQLQFLKKSLRNGAGEDMQKMFPEGFIFINALYGLSWSNFIQEFADTSKLYTEGIEELTWTINQTQTSKAKSIFNETLPLKYGAFYMGWTTYLLGSKLKIQRPENRNIKEVKLFKKNCRAIQYALEQQDLPYLESYGGNTWPADGIIAVSCLQLNNKYFKGKMDKTIQNWILKVKENLDSEYGLIPHKVSSVTGESLAGVRGCSQSLILNFIYDIDSTFAQNQFERYKTLFLDNKFGLYGIREYPKGVYGLGDVDSGPVIWGIGASASVVGQRTMGLYGETQLFNAIRNNIEGFGFGFSTGNEKKYLFGTLPMMDAFFAWSNALEKSQTENHRSTPIRWKFHTLSLLFILIIMLVVYKLKLSKRKLI